MRSFYAGVEVSVDTSDLYFPETHVESLATLLLVMKVLRLYHKEYNSRWLSSKEPIHAFIRSHYKHLDTHNL